MPPASSSAMFPSSSSGGAPISVPDVVKTENVDDATLAHAYQKAEEMALESPIAISGSPTPSPRRRFTCVLGSSGAVDLDGEPTSKKSKSDESAFG